MKKILLHKLKLGAGFTLIFVGILGCFLPIIPGIPLMLAGAAVVGFEHPWIQPFKSRFDRWRESLGKELKKDNSGREKF